MRLLSLLNVAVSALCVSATVAGFDIEGRGSSGGGGKYTAKSVPSRGETGVYTDKHSGITHIYYGDKVKEHASHISYHNDVYPSHKHQVYKPASGSASAKGSEYYENRHDALHGISSKGFGASGHVRDEKPLASFSYGHKETTVMKASDHESRIEGQLAKEAKSQHLSTRNGQGIMIHDNRSKATYYRHSDGTLDKYEPLAPMLKERDIDSDIVEITTKVVEVFKTIETDLKDVSEDMIDAVRQIWDPTSHQLGTFYKGFHLFDGFDQYNQIHNVSMNKTQLGYEQASIDVYASAWHNATSALGAKFTDDLGATEVNSTASAADFYGPDYALSDDESDDDSDDDTTSSTSVTKTATASSTYGAAYSTDAAASSTYDAAYSTDAAAYSTDAAAYSTDAAASSTYGAAYSTYAAASSTDGAAYSTYAAASSTFVTSTSTTVAKPKPTCTDEPKKSYDNTRRAMRRAEIRRGVADLS